MKNISHQSAKPSHYNQEAELYDGFNEKNSETINKLIAQVLTKYKAQTVLDLSCGTGSQVFWLTKKGFDVSGYDINAKMIKIAKSKAKKQRANIKFGIGDMRSTQAGNFDAVITIFNAIGHLTKKDFEKTLKNVSKNLNKNGLYIFDIFNLNYLLEADNITKLIIDRQISKGSTKHREIQYSTIDKDGVLASYDLYHEQKVNGKIKVTSAYQTLQVYNVLQLNEMLKKNGFKVPKQCSIDGGRFYDKKTERIFIIARKNIRPVIIWL